MLFSRWDAELVGEVLGWPAGGHAVNDPEAHRLCLRPKGLGFLSGGRTPRSGRQTSARTRGGRGRLAPGTRARYVEAPSRPGVLTSAMNSSGRLSRRYGGSCARL